MKNNKLNELSGLVESRQFPGVFYAIEDSGNEPVVYIINEDGTLKGRSARVIMASNISWNNNKPNCYHNIEKYKDFHISNQN